VFGLGGLIALVSYGLDPFMAFLRRRHGIKQYEQLEWCVNGTLQLQRLAHEAFDVGPWSGGTDWVPVTRRGKLLAVLDLTNPRLPRLQRLRNDIYTGDSDEPGSFFESKESFVDG
jgi:hypothetical protein